MPIVFPYMYIHIILTTNGKNILWDNNVYLEVNFTQLPCLLNNESN